MNGRIQEIKTVGRGYRKFENFRIAILFLCGGLDLKPYKNPIEPGFFGNHSKLSGISAEDCLESSESAYAKAMVHFLRLV